MLGSSLMMALSPATAALPEEQESMVWLDGGKFWMGTNDGLSHEGPRHRVKVDGFWIAKTEVTVGEFTRFTEATGYISEAEEIGWAGVFSHEESRWIAVEGAYWRYPHGPDGKAAQADEPVVQVSFRDANAYAQWVGKRLPTEAEWEYAARGGGEAEGHYWWGDALVPEDGHFRANLWQGQFPTHDTGADGFIGIAPVGSFEPNSVGLYDMAGNVWEWTSDWFAPNIYAARSNDEITINPRGGREGTTRVMRGGSFLCTPEFCKGYRLGSRNQATPDSALSHLGFRLVADNLD